MDNIKINGSLYESIQDYCEQNNIKKENFNEPVKIIENVKCCTFMFSGCYSFNQPVIIPDGAEDYKAMFDGCISFNQPIIIPDSVKNCSYMFYGCKSFNESITVNLNNLYLFKNEITITNKNFNNLKINTKILKECSFNKTIKIKLKDNITIKCSDKEFAELSLLQTLEN